MILPDNVFNKRLRIAATSAAETIVSNELTSTRLAHYSWSTLPNEDKQFLVETIVQSIRVQMHKPFKCREAQ
jgi:hypothetical protein